MEPSSVAPRLAQWQVAGDAAHAEAIAAIAAREARGQQTTAPPWAVATAFVVVAVVLALAVGTVVGAAIGGVLALLGLLVWWSPRAMARQVRRLPSSHEPYTVTLDVEGFHVVSPSVADHLRWRLFAGAAHRDGYLVLRFRGSGLVRVVPLEGLDPTVDRDRLVAEVDRLIAVDAAAVGAPPD